MQFRASGGQRDAVFEQEGADLVDQAHVVVHNELTGAVQRLQFKLLDRPHRNKTHARATERFRDSFSVVEVILLRFDERLYKLRSDQSHVMPKFEQAPRPVLRAGARFLPIRQVGKFARNSTR